MIERNILENWIEAFASARASGNVILIKYAKESLEVVLNELYKKPEPKTKHAKKSDKPTE